MEERQILSRKDANDSSIGNFRENQIVSKPPQHYNSFTKTQIESTIFEHTWQIDRFIEDYESINTLTSAPFPKTGQYKIEIIISQSTIHKKIDFYLLSKTKYQGSVHISIAAQKNINRKCVTELISQEEIFFNMSNKIHMNSILDSQFYSDDIKSLIVKCKIKVHYQILHNSMYLPVLPTASSETLESQNSIFDNNSTSDNRTIKFKIDNKYYVVSKKLLSAINSSYFEHLYSTYKEDEKDMTEEFEDIKEQIAFEQMLLFIITRSVPESANINEYKDLLKVAYIYDVQSLKLICEQYLSKKIYINNAINLMKLALACEAKHLEKCVLSFIKFYFKDIVCTKTFQSLSQEYSDKLIQLLAENKIDGTCTVVPLTYLP